MGESTKVSKRSSQTVPVIRPDAEPALLPLIPEESFPAASYVRWRDGVYRELGR